LTETIIMGCLRTHLLTSIAIQLSCLGSPSLFCLGCGDGSGKGAPTDGGVATGSWVLAASGLPAEQVGALAVDPSDPMTAYVGFQSTTFGAGSGIFKTIDGGASWAAINDGLVVPGQATSGTPAIYSLSIDRLQPRTVYAGGYYGLWRTTDAGMSWFPFGSTMDGGAGVPDLTASRTAVAVDPSDSNHVYVGAHFGIWITPDGGSSWNNLLAGPPVDAGDIAVDPSRSRIAYARTKGNYFRITGDAQADGLDTTDIHGYTGVVDATGALYLSATNVASTTTIAEILVSSDEGMSWVHADSGLSVLSMLPALHFAPNPPIVGTLYAVASVSVSTDGGTVASGRLLRLAGGAWSDVTGTLPSQIAIVATGTSDPGTVYVGTTDGKVYRSNGAP
jgi:hypothetical protein